LLSAVESLRAYKAVSFPGLDLSKHGLDPNQNPALNWKLSFNHQELIDSFKNKINQIILNLKK
jgi:hypothetical protein